MIDLASLASCSIQGARRTRPPTKRFEPFGEVRASSETGNAESISAREIKGNVTMLTLSPKPDQAGPTTLHTDKESISLGGSAKRVKKRSK